MNVSVSGEEPSGLASMLAELIRANLRTDPGRGALLRPSVVVLDAPDADVTVFLRIAPEGVRVGDGDVPDAHLRIRADAERLLDLTNVPLRLGFPDVGRPEGRAVVRDLLARRLRIRGLLRHPLRLSRATRLLSVADVEVRS
ncbi:MAG TPA: hypothetical protein VFZ75_13055 [Actinomycetota bacterium]|nr:hypothetical protein [Actinomycetota bacterium]